MTEDETTPQGDSHWPDRMRALPRFGSEIDAYRLSARDCEVLFASYEAGTRIPAHRHETENWGVITRGALYLTTAAGEVRHGVGDWYHLAANEEHAARFEEDTAEIEFWFQAPGEERVRPEGFPPIVPRIASPDPRAHHAFIAEVFGALGSYLEERPSELWIGDAMFLLAGSEWRGERPGFLYVYVPDVAACLQRARARGASVIEEPTEQFYGDLRATFEDPWGSLWQVARTRS